MSSENSIWNVITRLIIVGRILDFSFIMWLDYLNVFSIIPKIIVGEWDQCKSSWLNCPASESIHYYLNSSCNWLKYLIFSSW